MLDVTMNRGMMIEEIVAMYTILRKRSFLGKLRI